MSHEICHWGWARNRPGQPADGTDAAQVAALNAAGVQNTSVINNTWERGQYFEFMAYGTRLRAADVGYTFGVALNVHWRLLQAQGCGIWNENPRNAGNSVTARAAINADLMRLFRTLFCVNSCQGGLDLGNMPAGHFVGGH